MMVVAWAKFGDGSQADDWSDLLRHGDAWRGKSWNAKPRDQKRGSEVGVSLSRLGLSVWCRMRGNEDDKRQHPEQQLVARLSLFFQDKGDDIHLGSRVLDKNRTKKQLF
jgi:hypothetical protein